MKAYFEECVRAGVEPEVSPRSLSIIRPMMWGAGSDNPGPER
jgi:hypothetical protein